jgi:ribosomal-protein-alanine N-acetyltransferase
MPKVLETPRTFLRPFCLSDAEAAFDWFHDPEVMRFIPHGPDATLEASSARISRYLDHEAKFGFSKWIIFDRATGLPIGDSGFFYLPDLKRVELGYRLAKPWWGRGLATEVAFKWIEAAHPWYGFERVFAFAHPQNPASLHVMEKVGFRFSHQEELYGTNSPLYTIELIAR